MVDICEGPDTIQTEISATSHVNDDMNTDLPESSAAMLMSPMIFQRQCVVSSALPTLNQKIVNLTDVTMDMDADPPESSVPMINNSLGIRDCVSPVSEEEHDSAAHMDLRLGVKYSLRNLTDNCFGVCDLTHRLIHPRIDWCWECIDRLIWGYRVSCLVTIVTKDRAVGMGLFIEGSCVYASTQGLEDGPVKPCDVIPVYVWMTEKFKDVLNKVMLVDKATANSHSLQWGEDNRQVRGTHASVDNRPIRVPGRFGCLYSPVQGADWLDVLSVGGGPVGKDVGIGYIGDGFSQYQSSDAAPLTELQDLNKLLHIYSDCATGFYLIWTVNITVRISLSVEEVTSYCVRRRTVTVSDDGWCDVSRRPVWCHIHGRTMCAVGCPRSGG